MEIQTARKLYRWLWLSPLLTIPTLLIIFFAVDSFVYDLVCPQGFQSKHSNYHEFTGEKLILREYWRFLAV